MADHTLSSPKGFRTSAVKAGIKSSGNWDVGLIAAQNPCSAAAVFTTNKVVAAPIVVTREHIADGKAQAIFVNAGNANACTADRGLREARTICRLVGRHLQIEPTDVLVCSTGIIGRFLPMRKIRDGIAHAAASLSESAATARRLAQAIMTTDTKPKSAFQQIKIGAKVVKIAAIAKGAGMIAPNMATMLVFITTDAAISSSLLGQALREAASQTFNKVNIDNHCSTNDCAIALASSLAGNKTMSKTGKDYQLFAKALWQVCDDLARQMAADGEGATCAVTIKLTGAASSSDAKAAVQAIVASPLVRCAFNGADPNWGRIVSAVGFSQATCRLDKISCKIAGTAVFRRGRPCNFDAATLSRKMKQKHWLVEVDLGLGQFADFCYTCDLSKEYVRINADYHT